MDILGDFQHYYPFKDMKIKLTHKAGLSQFAQL